jgi:sphingomyelin phosphodiesterase acid-like 3
MKLMKEEHEDLDFILCPGDWLPHGFDNHANNEANAVEFLENMVRIIREYYPDTIIYPAIGNLDYTHGGDTHWGTLRNAENAREYYQFQSTMWFDPPLEASELETFMAGGYYIKEISPGIMLLSLNTQYYEQMIPEFELYVNEYQETVAWAQLAWFEE